VLTLTPGPMTMAAMMMSRPPLRQSGMETKKALSLAKTPNTMKKAPVQMPAGCQIFAEFHRCDGAQAMEGRSRQRRGMHRVRGYEWSTGRTKRT